MVAYALLTNHVHTMFGWELQLTDTWNARSLQNYPMQSNGAEMLRAACCMAIDAGVRICAPIHDAVLIEAEEDALEEAIATMQRCMAAAS